MNRKLKCDIIVTGSYLGYTLNPKFFKAVGDLELIQMYGMSFKEFCKAFGLEKELENVSLKGDFEESEYEKLYEIYNVYRRIGGYPRPVMTYKKTGDINRSLMVIEEIIDILNRESQLYFENKGEHLIFNDIYSTAWRSICTNKKGSGSKIVSQISKQIIDKNKNSLVTKQEVNGAIDWLVYSNILGVCNMYNGEKEGVFSSRKLYFMDCGLAYYMSLTTEDVDKSNIDGALSENFVYCEFKRLYSKRRLNNKVLGDNPRFMIYNNYELDFVINSKNNNKYGIEIKTNDGDPKSLRVIMSKDLLDYGVIAKRTVDGESDIRGKKVITIPIFLVGERFPYGLE